MEDQGEGGDGVVGRGRGCVGGLGHEASINPHQGTSSELDQGCRIALGGEAHFNPNQQTSLEPDQGHGTELLPQKRGRGRPRKNPLLPTPTPKLPKTPKQLEIQQQPKIPNPVTPSPAINPSPPAQVLAATPPVATSSEEPLKRKRGRPSKEELEHRARAAAEQSQQPSKATPEKELPSSLAAPQPTQPSPHINIAQRQHNFSPEVQPEPRQDQAFQENPWNSWQPQRFPSSLCNIQDMHVVHEEKQQPLVYGCSWPTYIVHPYHRPHIKRRKAHRKRATIVNTQVPTETQAQPQTNEQLQNTEEGSMEEQGNVMHNQIGTQDSEAMQPQCVQQAEGQLFWQDAYEAMQPQCVQQAEGQLFWQDAHGSSWWWQEADAQLRCQDFDGQCYYQDLEGQWCPMQTQVGTQESQGVEGQGNAMQPPVGVQDVQMGGQEVLDQGMQNMRGQGNVTQVLGQGIQDMEAQENVTQPQIADWDGLTDMGKQGEVLPPIPPPLQTSTAEQHQSIDASQMSTWQHQYTDASQTYSIQPSSFGMSTDEQEGEMLYALVKEFETLNDFVPNLDFLNDQSPQRRPM